MGYYNKQLKNQLIESTIPSLDINLQNFSHLTPVKRDEH
jgi:hypothetical protein